MAWRSNRSSHELLRSLAAILCLWVLLALACELPAARAAPNNATNEARLDSSVRYLQDAQNLDGGFGRNAGEASNQDVSGWVVFALAAAGINPQDQARPGGVDAYTYLTDHAAQALHEEPCKPLICTTSLERELLVVDASGTSPRDFGGIDFVGELLARELTDGSFPFVPEGRGEVNDTIYAILSLSLVLEPAAQDAVQRAARWLITAQNPDGSWPAQHPQIETGEVDMTGAAIEALNAAGLHNTQAQQRAFEYLHKAQNADGGFSEFPGEGESNVASTAWAVQGMWSAGENPETWVASSGEEPLSYMATLQQPDGHIRYEAGMEENGLWMTAMVAPTFAGQALPIAAVPRAIPSTPTSLNSGSSATPASPGTAEAGQGGQSAQAGSGVIAGGGGNGAPLFSRPQSQSQGSTAGGVRLLSTRGAVSKKASAGHRETSFRHSQVSAEQRETSAMHRQASAEHSQGSAGHGQGSAGHSQGSAGHGDASPKHSYEPDLQPEASTPTTTPTTPLSESAGGEVRGALVGAPSGTDTQAALKPGAPGLRSAEAGGNGTPWLAIGIGGATALLLLAGSLLERRRPQVIL